MKTSIIYADLGFEITTTIDEGIIGLEFRLGLQQTKPLLSYDDLEFEVTITIVEDITTLG